MRMVLVNERGLTIHRSHTNMGGYKSRSLELGMLLMFLLEGRGLRGRGGIVCRGWWVHRHLQQRRCPWRAIGLYNSNNNNCSRHLRIRVSGLDKDKGTCRPLTRRMLRI